jgi:succinate-acetate transporter protein
MAVGNTFGATALSSYGGFWLAFALILLPGTEVETNLLKEGTFYDSMGFFLMVRIR